MPLLAMIARTGDENQIKLPVHWAPEHRPDFLEYAQRVEALGAAVQREDTQEGR